MEEDEHGWKKERSGLVGGLWERRRLAIARGARYSKYSDYSELSSRGYETASTAGCVLSEDDWESDGGVG
jgi:hypothetical protein